MPQKISKIVALYPIIAGQVRKGTDIPYISHPIAVSSLVIEHGGDEDHAIAGLLHDVIEDCGKTVDKTASLFGSRVAGIVALSRAQGRLRGTAGRVVSRRLRASGIARPHLRLNPSPLISRKASPPALFYVRRRHPQRLRGKQRRGRS
jgi:hypothetical protein